MLEKPASLPRDLEAHILAVVEENGDNGSTLPDFAPERYDQRAAMAVIRTASQLVSNGQVALGYIDIGDGKNTRVYLPVGSQLAGKKAHPGYRGKAVKNG